jgi:hypothetical protein
MRHSQSPKGDFVMCSPRFQSTGVGLRLPCPIHANRRASAFAPRTLHLPIVGRRPSYPAPCICQSSGVALRILCLALANRRASAGSLLLISTSSHIGLRTLRLALSIAGRLLATAMLSNSMRRPSHTAPCSTNRQSPTCNLTHIPNHPLVQLPGPRHPNG